MCSIAGRNSTHCRCFQISWRERQTTKRSAFCVSCHNDRSDEMRAATRPTEQLSLISKFAGILDCFAQKQKYFTQFVWDFHRFIKSLEQVKRLQFLYLQGLFLYYYFSDKTKQFKCSYGFYHEFHFRTFFWNFLTDLHTVPNERSSFLYFQALLMTFVCCKL